MIYRQQLLQNMFNVVQCLLLLTLSKLFHLELFPSKIVMLNNKMCRHYYSFYIYYASNLKVAVRKPKFEFMSLPLYRYQCVVITTTNKRPAMATVSNSSCFIGSPYKAVAIVHFLVCLVT